MTEGMADFHDVWSMNEMDRKRTVADSARGMTAGSWLLTTAIVLFAIGSFLALGSGLSVIPVCFAVSQLIPPALLGIKWILGVLVGYSGLAASLILLGNFYVKIDLQAPWAYLVIGFMVVLMAYGPRLRQASSHGENEGSERA